MADIDSEKADILAVMDAVRRGLHDRDPHLIGAQFAPDAVIFDLAPPLAHTLDVPGLGAWLDTWNGPVGLDIRDWTVAVGGDIAFCHGLSKVSATTRDGQAADWWQRLTVCLKRTRDGWKIVHEHTSVPFYMDGSFRAAIDLAP